MALRDLVITGSQEAKNSEIPYPMYEIDGVSNSESVVVVGRISRPCCLCFLFELSDSLRYELIWFQN